MWKLAAIAHLTIILESAHDKLATERDVVRQWTQSNHLHCLVHNHYSHRLRPFLVFVQESLKAAVFDEPDGMWVLVQTLGAHLVLPGH